MGWGKIRALVDAGAADPVAEAVRVLDEAGRREVARALPGHLRAVRARRERWDAFERHVEPFRAAGAGTIAGSAAVASWLNRRDLNPPRRRHRDAGRLLDLWEDRPAEWLADLARRVTRNLRGPDHRDGDLALALLRRTGVEPPAHDPLVIAWSAEGPWRADDPLLPHLLPRLFEAGGTGHWLYLREGWLDALSDMVEQGAAERAALLDGCVRRLLRGGGSATEPWFFLKLHQRLETDADVPRHAHDYLRMLPSASGQVAAHALDLLRRHGDLEAAQVVAALEAALSRREAGLVRAGLSWLDQTVRRHPERAAECAVLLARAFGHTSPVVQRQAVRVALKLPPDVGAAAERGLREAVPLLPAELGAQLAERFGGEVAEEERPAPDLPRVVAAEPVPLYPSIATAAGFAHLITLEQPSWSMAEQLMAGFVRLAHDDRDGFAAVLEPVFRTGLGWWADDLAVWPTEREWLLAASRRLLGHDIGPARPPVSPFDVPPGSTFLDRMPGERRASPIDLLWLHRCAELQRGLDTGFVPPVLLATPTEPTGRLDPTVLMGRLAAHQDAGVEPYPADLQQALLRLPAEGDVQAARRARALSLSAAQVVARWLADPPEVAVEASFAKRGRPGFTLRARRTGLTLIDEVFRTPQRPRPERPSPNRHLWPYALPSHPEVAAAYLITHPDDPGPADRTDPVLLCDLLAGGGERGGTRRGIRRGAWDEALAWYAAAELGGDQRGQDALEIMAARGDLPAGALGHALARRVRDGGIGLARVVTALERLARRGAHGQVWETVAAMLADLTPEPGERPVAAFARLVALGARTARWSEARGALPAVAELAGRKGTANMLAEARRLHAYLTRA
ncbi:DUF7824 domain-containing protein [Actinomadura hibisca]|uniref:DUF7824 domain-containing protein n=1 Tax=Actinomadura hibisca TaxID=68565 RepID=UPI0008338A06|nr:DUF6493 family protein [Actinomadura hibisca]